MFQERGGVEEMEQAMLKGDTVIYNMAKDLLDEYFGIRQQEETMMTDNF
jgi:hypothetical protein